MRFPWLQMGAPRIICDMIPGHHICIRETDAAGGIFSNHQSLGWVSLTNRFQGSDLESQSSSPFALWASSKKWVRRGLSSSWPVRVRLRRYGWWVSTTDERAGQRRRYRSTHRRILHSSSVKPLDHIPSCPVSPERAVETGRGGKVS